MKYYDGHQKPVCGPLGSPKNIFCGGVLGGSFNFRDQTPGLQHARHIPLTPKLFDLLSIPKNRNCCFSFIPFYFGLGDTYNNVLGLLPALCSRISLLMLSGTLEWNMGQLHKDKYHS